MELKNVIWYNIWENALKKLTCKFSLHCFWEGKKKNFWLGVEPENSQHRRSIEGQRVWVKLLPTCVWLVHAPLPSLFLPVEILLKTIPLPCHAKILEFSSLGFAFMYFFIYILNSQMILEIATSGLPTLCISFPWMCVKPINKIKLHYLGKVII